MGGLFVIGWVGGGLGCLALNWPVMGVDELSEWLVTFLASIWKSTQLDIDHIDIIIIIIHHCSVLILPQIHPWPPWLQRPPNFEYDNLELAPPLTLHCMGIFIISKAVTAVPQTSVWLVMDHHGPSHCCLFNSTLDCFKGFYCNFPFFYRPWRA